MTKTLNISVVVPVYKEEGNVPEFLRRIAEILEAITEPNQPARGTEGLMTPIRANNKLN